MLRENPKLPSWVPGGHPMNPLGVRALYLGSSTYRIHGTDAPWTIGTAASKGCIRMFNRDVLDLYPRVPVGTKVTVTWQRFEGDAGGYAVSASGPPGDAWAEGPRPASQAVSRLRSRTASRPCSVAASACARWRRTTFPRAITTADALGGQPVERVLDAGTHVPVDVADRLRAAQRRRRWDPHVSGRSLPSRPPARQ